MFGLTRGNPVEDLFSFQREVERLFDQFWRDLPTRQASSWSPSSFQVNTSDEGWRLDVPLPGVNPEDVVLEVAGNTLSVRVEESAEGKGTKVSRYEQTLTVPQFLDLEKINAAHRHGMLQLTIPLKESVRPRRIQIETPAEDRKQLAGV